MSHGCICYIRIDRYIEIEQNMAPGRDYIHQIILSISNIHSNCHEIGTPRSHLHSKPCNRTNSGPASCDIRLSKQMRSLSTTWFPVNSSECNKADIFLSVCQARRRSSLKSYSDKLERLERFSHKKPNLHITHWIQIKLEIKHDHLKTLFGVDVVFGSLCSIEHWNSWAFSRTCKLERIDANQ